MLFHTANNPLNMHPTEFSVCLLKLLYMKSGTFFWTIENIKPDSQGVKKSLNKD